MLVLIKDPGLIQREREKKIKSFFVVQSFIIILAIRSHCSVSPQAGNYSSTSSG